MKKHTSRFFCTLVFVIPSIFCFAQSETVPKEVKINYKDADMDGPNKIKGTIATLDVQSGNISTNISSGLFREFDAKFGDKIHVTIFHNITDDKIIKVYEADMPYRATFADVTKGKPLLYLNSLMQVSFALRQQSFLAVNHVGSGSEWTVELVKK